MLFFVTLLAVVLLGFGVVQLARVASRGEFAGIETFGFALVLGATALVLPSAVGWFAYRALDRQIGSLTSQVDDTPAGTHRAFAVEGSGAAGELASALTRLVAELADRVDDGRRESRLLQSVVVAMKEGMVVLGADRKIRIANDAFRLLFRTPFDPVGGSSPRSCATPRCFASSRRPSLREARSGRRSFTSPARTLVPAARLAAGGGSADEPAGP
jgi:PAS domain-containing protein